MSEPSCGKPRATRAAQSAFALLLAALLCCFGVPASATEAAVGEPTTTERTVGAGSHARTVEDLLDAGPYAEGRVLARVTSDFNPVTPYSNEGGFAVEELYAYSTAERAADAAPEAGARALAAEPDEPDRVVLIESSTQTTEELLSSLIDMPGVVMAEPDYTGTLDDAVVQDGLSASHDPAASAGAADAASPAAALDASAPTATPNDPLLPSQYFLQDTVDATGGTNVQALWSKLWNDVPSSATVPEDQQVIIAVLDTGVNFEHPDLKDVMWNGGKSVAPWSGACGYDFANDNDSPQDDYGHGTHVAGIVAAAVNNGEGGASMAPNARIMALRGAGGDGQFHTSSVMKAYQYLKLAETKGVHVTAVNNSWGGPGGASLMTSAMDDLYQTYGVLSVCASGNANNDHDVNGDLPSGLLSEGIIAVNATEKDGSKVSFSDYGSMTTDIAAPGGGILSTAIDKDATLKLADEGKLAFRETFDTEEYRLKFSPVEGEGFGAATLEFTQEADAQHKPDGSGLLWSIDAPEAGETFAIDLKALNVDFRGNPPTAVAFDAKGFSVGREPGDVTLSRFVKVYMATTDGGWTRINKDRETYIADNQWQTQMLPIPQEAAALIDWSEPTIRIERVFAELDAGIDVRFSFDNVSLAYDGAYEMLRYVSFSGTSMAAPVVSGAIALLAKAYPDDTAATRKARVLGSVARDSRLTGTCTTDGRLDLSRTDNPYPVIESVTQDEDDPSTIVIEGAFFGDTPGSLSIESIGPVQTASWSNAKVIATLPEGFEGALRYVTVERGGNQDTGRLRAYLTGTSSTASKAFFDSLPAPDLAALNVDAVNDQDLSWKVAEAGGTVYATSEFIGKQNPKADESEDEPESFMRMLAFDPVAQTWSVDERFSKLPGGAYLMCSYGSQMYLFDTESLEVHRLNPATGSVDLLFDLSDTPTAGEPSAFYWGSLACDGQRLWLVGECLPNNGEVVGETATITVDLATGRAQDGPSLSTGRLHPSVQFVDGALTLAAGSQQLAALEFSTDRLVEGAFRPAAPLPATVRADQLATAASATLPAGSALVASDGTPFTLKSECMIVSGLVSDEGAANPADTYVFDPRAGTWTALQEQLAPVKISYTGGALCNGSFYVLGYDATGATGNADGLVFKRLKVHEGSGGSDVPEPVEPEKPQPGAPEADTPEDGAGTPKPLVSTGDHTAEVAGVLGLALAGALVSAGGARAAARRRRGNAR